MNRPAGVTASAVLLILGSLFAALMGVVMLFARSFAPPTTPAPPYVGTVMMLAAGILFAFALWGVLSAVGLFRMRSWARLSTLVIAALVVILFGISIAMLFFLMQQTPELENAGSGFVGVVIGIYTIPILTGIWWLIYFNRAGVKAAFLERQPAVTGPTPPLSVTVIAWHFVAFGVLTAIGYWWFQLPAFVLGLWLTGWAAASLYCVLAIAELLIGVGLLSLKPWSLNAAAYFCIYCMLNSIVFPFVPQANARMLAAIQESFSHLSESSASAELPDPLLNAAGGVMFMALPLYYLVTRKRAFLEAGQAAQVRATV